LDHKYKFYLQLNSKELHFVLMTAKQQFLEEHNKLAPEGLKATLFLLDKFRQEKSSLFKDNEWSLDKLRRPFIMWLTSLTIREKEGIKNNKEI
jgi:hypothetical protein